MKACVVDLNNFASYPTISVGLIVAILREAGIDVNVFSPLSVGVKGVNREPRVPAYGLFLDRWSYRTAVSKSALVSGLRRQLSRRRLSELVRRSDVVSKHLGSHLDREKPDIVLISTYLMYGPLCRSIAAACQQRGIPVVIGGQYFVEPQVVNEWLQIDGVDAIVGGEVEHELAEIVRRVIQCEDVSGFAGVFTRRSDTVLPAPPLTQLDSIPYADYRDFDWQRYSTPIVPMITGRGCAWGVCTFCSDVTSAAGRTFRSRSIDKILGEIDHQASRHGTGRFVFTDLKLNSNPLVWRGLIDGIRKVRSDATWIGAIHVGSSGRDLMDADDFVSAGHAGMVRLTTGLETGSQRIADLMRKGTELSHTSRCLNAAHRAGISVRVTLIIGYPGETAEDVQATAKYLADHENCVERARLNRFQIVMGTKFHDDLVASNGSSPDITDLQESPGEALVDHHYRLAGDRRYRQAVDQLLAVVHRINRKPLRQIARDFNGVM